MLIVDGKRISLESGEWARTPVPMITNLRYGRTYSLRLEKEGFEPFECEIEMGADWDGTTFSAELKPSPAFP
ncbi:MAG: PEGA domain-containing protein [Deltaproteobacteria bacterium]|nr:PEGA domain-containing protein [Deltaproteobacteria bacterium]